jgi:aminoglycoside N3'-acetyltransferase
MMGCGASDINPGLTIELTNQSRDACIYVAGEHVECTVQFDSSLYDPDAKLKGAFIELFGQVVYTTTNTSAGPNGTIQTTYTNHKIPFFCERQHFDLELTSVRRIHILNENQTESKNVYSSQKRNFSFL